MSDASPEADRRSDEASVAGPEDAAYEGQPPVDPPSVDPLPPRPAWTTATKMVHTPVEHAKGVADVVAHVPAGYDPSAPIHLVIFFHGSGQCITQLALGGDVPCRRGGRTYVGAGVAWR
ncbi:MAG: hypothetical protein JOZ69_21905, partial [Myxococcales bacterium]|nr:hypothetical protein [Myxococcales bacterium]